MADKATRFEKELSGELGEFWKKNAKEELEKFRKYVKDGEFLVDESGIARSRYGDAVMEDVLEKLAYVTTGIDVEATRAARKEEDERFIEQYRANKHPLSEEELLEMRAAFGEGETVVDIFSGETFHI